MECTNRYRECKKRDISLDQSIENSSGLHLSGITIFEPPLVNCPSIDNRFHSRIELNDASL
jgi:hypothetical protein